METPEDATLLLALGRLHESKAFDTLIQAVGELRGVYLWIAGEGPDRGKLENLIKRLGVEHRVKLLGWRQDRAALFQACDIFVFPSRYEPFGTVFGEDGLLFPIDDVESLKYSIKALIDNDNLCQKLVENGYARYQGEFTKAKSVAEYLGFYHEIRGFEGLTD